MHCQADHFNFCLELFVSSDCISIFEPFYSNNCAITKTTFVHVSKTAFSQYLLVTEVVCGNLKFPKLEPPQVSQTHLFMMLFWNYQQAWSKTSLVSRDSSNIGFSCISYSPLMSKKICLLCFCLHHRKIPNPIISRQMHPRLVPKAKAILWVLDLPKGWASEIL